MQRYKSSYGGIETIVGTFPKWEVEQRFGVRLPTLKEEGKVFDRMFDGREIIGYMVDDHHIEIRVVNA